MADSPRPYTREELEGLPRGAMPTRGDYLLCCKVFRPAFELSPSEEKHLRSMSQREAIEELCELTGCPPTWADIWCQHAPGSYHVFEGASGGLPLCPECSEPLRTPQAKQCFECGANWHGSEKPGTEVEAKLSSSPLLESLVMMLAIILLVFSILSMFMLGGMNPWTGPIWLVCSLCLFLIHHYGLAKTRFEKSCSKIGALAAIVFLGVIIGMTIWAYLEYYFGFRPRNPFE